MTTKDRIQLLADARNILHAQEEGKEIAAYDITRAHDLIDIVLDDMVNDDFHERMEEAEEAMTEPQIEISEDASDEQRELVEKINFALNGVSHAFKEPIRLDFMENGVFAGSILCECVCYALDTIVATKYNYYEDNWDFVRLDTIRPAALDALWAKIIDELY